MREQIDGTPPKLLLFGARGQLGHDCQEIFAGRFEVVGLGSAELDLRDGAAVERKIGEIRPRVIINAAAHTRVDDCENEVEDAFLINAEAPARMARAAREYGALLVQVSTDYVFPGDRRPPDGYAESDAVGPVSVYGRSKLAGEEAVAASGCDYIIARTAWLYGCRGRNFLKTMLRLSLADPGRRLKVVDDQWGCPTWSRTLAQQLLHLVVSGGRGLYHTVAGDFTTWYGLARAFFELLGREAVLVPCATREYPTPARRPENSILLNRRLAAEERLRMVPWREDLAAFVAAWGAHLLHEARVAAGGDSPRLTELKSAEGDVK